MWWRSGRQSAVAVALWLAMSSTAAGQIDVVSQNCLHLGWRWPTPNKVTGIVNASLNVNVRLLILQEVMPAGGVLGMNAILAALGAPGTYNIGFSPAYGVGSYQEMYAFYAHNTLLMGGVRGTGVGAAGAFSRPPAGVAITYNGNQFWLLNYHAVFGKNAAVRQAEVRQMPNAVNTFTAFLNVPVIIGGDWNLPTTDAAFQPLTMAGFGLGPNDITSLNPQGVLSSRYDHFAWRGAAAPQNPRVLPPLMTNPQWRTQVSDHLGITCRLP